MNFSLLRELYKHVSIDIYNKTSFVYYSNKIYLYWKYLSDCNLFIFSSFLFLCSSYLADLCKGLADSIVANQECLMKDCMNVWVCLEW